MPDNGRDRGRDLEQELRDLGSHLEYPPTPDLARTARLRLEAEADEDAARANRRGRFWLPALSPRWAVAAMFVVVLAVPALSPAARESLSGLLVVGGGASYSGGGAGGGAAQSAGEAGDAEADKVMSGQAESQAAPSEAEIIPESAGGGQEESAEASGAEAGEAMPESDSAGQVGCLHCGDNIGTDDRYAKRITLREARIRAREGGPVLLPRVIASDKPDAVYKVKQSSRKGLALVYRAKPGMPAFGNTEIGVVLTENPGDLGSTYLRGGPNKAMFEEVNVGGRRGYWSPQWPVYWVPGLRRSPSSMPSPTESVLLWEQEGLSLRLESKLTREEAIRIAESVR